MLVGSGQVRSDGIKLKKFNKVFRLCLESRFDCCQANASAGATGDALPCFVWVGFSNRVTGRAVGWFGAWYHTIGLPASRVGIGMIEDLARTWELPLQFEQYSCCRYRGKHLNTRIEKVFS